MIRLEHLEKAFANGTTVLKDVNCTINKGDVIAVIGPSGTGKSTLLRCINMLDAPTNGSIYFDDEEITKEDYDLSKLHRKVNMVFQSFNLFEHLSAIENVMLAQVYVLKKDKKEAYDKGLKLLGLVGLANKKDNSIKSLSGGQRQRVAIARTLAMNPEVILFDEPTSALDPSNVDEVKAVIRDVANSGTTMLIVSHDMDFVKSVANRVFYMDQGIIYEDGTPEQIFDHPTKELTKRFIKRIKTLEIDIHEKEFSYQELMNSISEYAKHNNIANDLTHKLQLVSEELLCNVLFPNLDNDLKIHLLYEYSDSRKHASISLFYNGEKLDLSKNTRKNNAAYKLLKQLAFEIEYLYDDSSELGNKIKIKVKS